MYQRLEVIGASVCTVGTASNRRVVARMEPGTAHYAALFAVSPEMLVVLELAVRYLEHPDVVAMPFAMNTGPVARRMHDLIARAKS